jgi:hypothetical protein
MGYCCFIKKFLLYLPNTCQISWEKKSYNLYENCNFAFVGIMLLDKLLRFCKASSIVYTSEFYILAKFTFWTRLNARWEQLSLTCQQG